MEEQFIPYELALKLKELGFDELCLARFNGGGFYMLPAYDPLRNSEIKEPWFCTAPLWQQAFDWFREKHGYLPIISNYSSTITPNFGYSAEDFLKDDEDLSKSSILSTTGFKTYEEARQACLEKLIELCEKN